jgi:hypothetical protein
VPQVSSREGEALSLTCQMLARLARLAGLPPVCELPAPARSRRERYARYIRLYTKSEVYPCGGATILTTGAEAANLANLANLAGAAVATWLSVPGMA